MKDGFSEGFLLGFKLGLSDSTAEQKNPAEIDVKKIKLIEGKQATKVWAIQKGIIKK